MRNWVFWLYVTAITLLLVNGIWLSTINYERARLNERYSQVLDRIEELNEKEAHSNEALQRKLSEVQNRAEKILTQLEGG
ncbi:hypothetical protein [Paenibacillus sp. SYP-B4298]|uniref:hypothetical protein n=1 Tax=Paenibacillus sp. SYP-B4298 TaxID=2996034 RepID=UPI0022DE76F6|nr:hypothetical protein [Paenibacillus sp. SYP-B4298]